LESSFFLHRYSHNGCSENWNHLWPECWSHHHRSRVEDAHVLQEGCCKSLTTDGTEVYGRRMDRWMNISEGSTDTSQLDFFFLEMSQDLGFKATPSSLSVSRMHVSTRIQHAIEDHRHQHSCDGASMGHKLPEAHGKLMIFSRLLISLDLYFRIWKSDTEVSVGVTHLYGT